MLSKIINDLYILDQINLITSILVKYINLIYFELYLNKFRLKYNIIMNFIEIILNGIESSLYMYLGVFWILIVNFFTITMEKIVLA